MLENIYACQMCRKPFVRTGSSKICTACLDQIEIDFGKIKDYLYDNPGRLTATELAEKAEVPEKTVLHLIREGRLEMTDTLGEGGGLYCEMCKKPIFEGTLCEKCKRQIAASIEKNLPKPEVAEPKPVATKHYGKMHTYRKDE